MRIESLRDLLSQFPDVDGFWNFDDLTQTETIIKEQLDAEKMANSTRLVELLTQLARVQGLLGKLTDAGATLLLANDLLGKHHEGGPLRAKIRFLIEQGRFFGLSMNSHQSLAYFAKAWELASPSDQTFFIIEAAVMLSVSQPPKYQNEWLQRALKMAEEATDNDSKLWLSQLYTMAGWHSFDFRKYDEALDNFQKALAQPYSEKEKSKLQRIKWAVGRTLRALNRLEESLEMQRALQAELEAEGKINGHVILEIGECLQLLKRYSEAKPCFESAYKELSLNGWYSDNKSLELSRIQHLSKKN
jgi:tetratricopeptide (TPR) repeat protein